VGIPSIIAGRGTNVGIGFAIPAETVQLIVRQLKEFGAPVRGWLGVQIQPVDEDLAKAMKLPNKTGALVAAVNEASPAEKAGFKTGEVIVSYNGKAITKVVDLPRQVAETSVGSKVTIEVVRDGKRLTLSPTIAKMTEEVEVADKGGITEKPSGKGVFGLQVADLTDLLRQRFGLDKDARGVVVVGVDRRSPAAEANLRVGDLVLKVNQDNVRNEAEFRKQVAADGDGSVLLLVSRQGVNLFVALNKDAGK
jgi:serine protease Do